MRFLTSACFRPFDNYSPGFHDASFPVILSSSGVSFDNPSSVLLVSCNIDVQLPFFFCSLHRLSRVEGTLSSKKFRDPNKKLEVFSLFFFSKLSPNGVVLAKI